jgi:uncharacterized protein (DUF302 family)
MKTQQIIIGLMLILFSLSAMSQKEITEKDYYFSKTVKGNMEEVTDKVKSSLKDQGFGIVTEIDMHKTLKEKLDVKMNGYRILGACNAKYAHNTIQKEDNIGVFLPCKVILKENDNNTVEVVSVNPSKLMKMLGNQDLEPIAEDVTELFRKALQQL